MKETKPLAALVGCTASGKSDLAIKLAQKSGAHIISCDSLLVYRDLNIGTAKPTPQELTLAPHHAIDLVNADEPFTAGDYVRAVRPIIEDLVKKKIPVLIVGGTGFYLKALLFGIWDAPATDPEFREAAELKSSESLFEELQKKDPPYAVKISGADRYRVIRALEIIHATGETLSARLLRLKPQDPLPYGCPIFGLRRSTVELERRIETRTNKMFEAGFITEVRALQERYGSDLRSLRSVGYTEVNELLKGNMTLAECHERIVISTRQLAKKQRTFFKSYFKEGECPIEWIDVPQHEEELFNKVLAVLQSGK